MAYTIGYCPQCGAQIMVQDTNGRWNSFKRNYRQLDMVFENGQKSRTIICATCAQAPNAQVLIDSILAPNSQAGEMAIAMIRPLGLPVGFEVRGRSWQ